MKRIAIVVVVTAALVVGHLQLRAAETAKFRYIAAMYADGKGLGLKQPEGIACGAKGQIVVGDTGNDRLVRFTYENKTVSNGVEVKVPELSSPSRVQLNSKGEIYALDTVQRRVVHLTPAGELKDVIAFSGVPAPTPVVPKGLAIDSSDNVYVLDVFGARVLVLDAQGQFQKALAFPADIGFGSDVAIDSAGSVLLLDSLKRRIFSAAKDATAFTPVGGDLSGTIVTLPTYLMPTKSGIFVVEGNGSSIVGLGRDGAFLSRQLSMGWAEGSLNHPSQMCVNDADEVFIADSGNSRVQIFQLIR